MYFCYQIGFVKCVGKAIVSSWVVQKRSPPNFVILSNSGPKFFFSDIPPKKNLNTEYGLHTALGL